MRKSLKDVVNPTIKILEDYFNPDSIYFLGTAKTMQNWKHPCANTIVSKMKNRETIRQTRIARRKY